MRVFLAANILFSAAASHSRLRALLGVVARHGECITNGYAVEEARRNLVLKQPDVVPQFENLVRDLEQVSGLVTNLPVKIAAKDVPILGGAIGSRATHLLTGDERDFGIYFGKAIRGGEGCFPSIVSGRTRQTWLAIVGYDL